MMDATFLQASMLKDAPEIKQFIKQKFNLFFNFGRTLSKQLAEYSDKKNQPEIDQHAAFIYECMKEIADSKRPDIALAMLKELNNGNVIIEE